MLRDTDFARELGTRLERLIAHDCSPVVFHFLRHFAIWASWLPRHAPRLEHLHAGAEATTAGARHEG